MTRIPDRPYTIVSCAVSVDGYLDDASGSRLVLSGPEDLDEVDGLRAAADAILVGAGTIRADNPRLLVRSPARVAARAGRGLPPHPRRVTLTSSGSLPPDARFFAGPGPVPLVYCAAGMAAELAGRLGTAARVVSAGAVPSVAAVLADLYAERSVRCVLIEGGSRVLREVLAGDLADELRLAVAPFFIGSPGAPRFALPARYPRGPGRPMQLAAVRQAGSVAVLHYLLTGRPRPQALPPLA